MRILFLILVPSLALAASQQYRYPYPRGLDSEMQNIYQNIPDKTTTPAIYIGSGAPSFAPGKIGDIFVSTSTSKVYISTGSATSGNWAIVN